MTSVSESDNFSPKNFADNAGMRSTHGRRSQYDPETQSIAQPFDAIRGTVFGLSQRLGGDKMNAFYEEIVKHDKPNSGVSIPLPPGFARSRMFWKMLLMNALIASFIGVMCCGFMNFVTKVPTIWDTCDYDTNPSCGEYYKGNIWWIAVTGGTGFVVGCLRWYFEYPDDLALLFQEVAEGYVDYRWAPHTFFLSAISIGGGANVGPEQALCNLGGGLCSWLAKYVDFEGDDEYKKLFILSGMAAALGSLFPSPILGVMIVNELGSPPKSYMESTLLLAVSACVSWAVYHEIAIHSYIGKANDNGIQLAIGWGTYQDWQITTGFAIGVVSGGLTMCILVIIAFVKQIFSRIKFRLHHFKFLKTVVPITLAGVTMGVLNWVLPATVSNGNPRIFVWAIQFGSTGLISQQLLIITALVRAVTVGLSMSTGYIGGMMSPYMTIGMLAGVVCHINYPFIPLGLSVGTFMVSVVCGVVPLPITFTCLSAFIYYFGLYQVAPIFVSCVTSYLIVCGSGWYKVLTRTNKLNLAEAQRAISHSMELNSNITNVANPMAKPQTDPVSDHTDDVDVREDSRDAL